MQDGPVSSGQRSPAQPVTAHAPAGTGDPAATALAEAWRRIGAEVEALRPAAATRQWLARMEPVRLRGGTLHLAVRGVRSARWVRETYGALLTRAAQSCLGVGVRVVVDLDTTLGGALASLGMPVASRWSAPPPFVELAETQLVSRALERLAREVRPEFGRVLVTGPEGCGKTHLVRVFLHRRQVRFPREHWLYRRGARLFGEFSRACRDGDRSAFQGKLLAHDGLVLEDVHELVGKLRCQEALAPVLETLRARGRPVLLTGELPGRSPRDFLPLFRSLLASGLHLPVPALCSASRAAILGERGRTLRVPPWVVDEVARRGTLPLKDALRALERVDRRARLLRRAPQPEEVWQILPAPPPTAAPDPMDRLIERCAGYCGASRAAVVGGQRSRAAALARHLVIYLAIEVFGLQPRTVRRWLGTLSPSVLPYVRRKLDAMRRDQPRIEGFLREVTEEIGRGQRFLFSDRAQGGGAQDSAPARP